MHRYSKEDNEWNKESEKLIIYVVKLDERTANVIHHMAN